MNISKNRLRTLAAMAAVLLILALFAGLPGFDAMHQRGVVTASATFALEIQEPGHYASTLSTGRSAMGTTTLKQQVLEFPRGDRVELSLEPSLVQGARVDAGAPLVTIRSTRNTRRLAELQAERAALAAQRQEEVAGARPEAIVQAAKALNLARARRDRSLPELERLRSLAAQGAASEAELESAELQARVRELQVSLAAAAHNLVRAGARPEALERLDAELEAIDAHIVEVETLLGGEVVRSPIAGVVALGGPTTIVRVYALDKVYVRVPVPEADVHLLDRQGVVDFASPSTASGMVTGHIIETSEAATSLNNQQVFWISAEFDNTDGTLRPGMTGQARLPLSADRPNLMSATLRNLFEAGP